MRKESQHYQQSQNINQSSKWQCQDNKKTLKRLTQINSKADFIQLLKSLPFEIRYLAVKVEAPGLPNTIRNALKKLQAKIQSTDNKKYGSKYCKIIYESLVFVSDGRDFFDSICFDFNYIQHPEKLYDLLMNCQQNAKKFNPIQEMNKNRKPIPDCIIQINSCKTKQELFGTIIKILRHQIFYNCCKKGQIQLNDQKHRKKQLSYYWKNLSQESKRKILFINKGDIKQLQSHLVNLNINIKLEDLQKEILYLLGLEKNQFCNRILKCKLKKSFNGMTDYHQQIYSIWKRDLERSKRKRNRKNNHIKQQHQKMPKQNSFSLKNQNYKTCSEDNQRISVKYLQKQKGKKQKQKRQKSYSVDSYQTNQTQVEWQLKFKQQTQFRQQQKKTQIEKLIEEQISNNIIQCSDCISKEANLFFDRRFIAYSRIQFIMKIYSIPIKLFGSCANGIAIKNSDIDIALDNSITNYFTYCQENDKPKLALQWFSSIFQGFKWVENLKLIKNATVPVLKMTINTQIDIQLFSMNYQLDPVSLEYLNTLNKEHNKGKIQIDITVETQSKTFECNHLGIKSTQQINQWLQSFKSLRYLTIILKHYLTMENLNVTYQGGINTYVMIVMLVAAIYKLKLQDQENVKVFSESILKFYAHQFDQNKFGIDIRDKQNPFYIKKIQDFNQKHLEYSKAQLQVLDPLNNGKIMTKKCYNFTKIKELFQIIYVQCFCKFRKSQSNFLNKNLRMNQKQEMYDSQSSEIESASSKKGQSQNPFLLMLVKEKK